MFIELSHTKFLRRGTLDEKLVQALETDYTTLHHRTERVMLDTSEAHQGCNQIGRMTMMGCARLASRQQFSNTLIASWFNYIIGWRTRSAWDANRSS